MKKTFCIIIPLFLSLSACNSTKIDPFKFVRVLNIDNTDFQLIYSSDAPVSVLDATYSISVHEDSITVTFKDNSNFSKTSDNLIKDNLASIAPKEQAREYLINESKLPTTNSFTECSRSSSDKSYPVLFGLNLVYFIPRKTDVTISDIYVFSNILRDKDQFISIDPRSWMFSLSIKSENPIIGNELTVNQEKVLDLKHTLKINSYKCEDY